MDAFEFPLPTDDGNPVIELQMARQELMRGIAEEVDHPFAITVVSVESTTDETGMLVQSGGDTPRTQELARSFLDDYPEIVRQRIAQTALPTAIKDKVQFLADFARQHSVANVLTYFEPGELMGTVHVEDLAALLFGGDTGEDEQGTIGAEPLEKTLYSLGVLRTFKAIADAFAGMVDTSDALERSRADLLFSGGATSSIIRGQTWAHISRDITRTVFGIHDDELSAKRGYGVNDLIQFGEAVRDCLEERINGIVEVTDDLPSEMLLRPGDLAAFGLSSALASKIFDDLSLTTGGVPAYGTNGYPWQRRPFLDVGDETYLTIASTSLLNDLHALVETLLDESGIPYRERRDAALEEMTASLVSAELPGCVTIIGGHYTDDRGRDCETDVLIVSARALLICECKAHRMDADLALRDPEAQLNTAVDAVHVGLEQARRLARTLATNGSVEIRREDGTTHVLDSNDIDYVLPLNVTLSAMGSIQTQAGVISHVGSMETYTAGHSLYVGDLMSILDLVEAPDELLAFLAWRSAMPVGRSIATADELDLFGMFRYRTQSIGPHLVNGKMLNLANSTSDFDTYYNMRSAGMTHYPKPRSMLPARAAEWARAQWHAAPRGWLEEVLVVRSAGAGALGLLSGTIKKPFNAPKPITLIGDVAIIVTTERYKVTETALLCTINRNARRVIGVTPSGWILAPTLCQHVEAERLLGTAYI